MRPIILPAISTTLLCLWASLAGAEERFSAAEFEAALVQQLNDEWVAVHIEAYEYPEAFHPILKQHFAELTESAVFLSAWGEYASSHPEISTLEPISQEVGKEFSDWYDGLIISGSARVGLEDQRIAFTTMKQMLERLSPEQCGTFLRGKDNEDARRVWAEVTSEMSAEWFEATMRVVGNSVLAEIKGTSELEPLTEAELAEVHKILDRELLTPIRARPDAAVLLDAIEHSHDAVPSDLCIVGIMLLSVTLRLEGADGDLLVRNMGQNRN